MQRELGPKCTDAFHWDKCKSILEILLWCSFIYGGVEEVFRQDGNEMMESQQSTCYTDLKEKTNNPNLKGNSSSPS